MIDREMSEVNQLKRPFSEAFLTCMHGSPSCNPDAEVQDVGRSDGMAFVRILLGPKVRCIAYYSGVVGRSGNKWNRECAERL